MKLRRITSAIKATLERTVHVSVLDSPHPSRDNSHMVLPMHISSPDPPRVYDLNDIAIPAPEIVNAPSGSGHVCQSTSIGFRDAVEMTILSPAPDGSSQASGSGSDTTRVDREPDAQFRVLIHAPVDNGYDEDLGIWRLEGLVPTDEMWYRKREFIPM